MYIVKVQRIALRVKAKRLIIKTVFNWSLDIIYLSFLTKEDVVCSLVRTFVDRALTCVCVCIHDVTSKWTAQRLGSNKELMKVNSFSSSIARATCSILHGVRIATNLLPSSLEFGVHRSKQHADEDGFEIRTFRLLRMCAHENWRSPKERTATRILLCRPSDQPLYVCSTFGNFSVHPDRIFVWERWKENFKAKCRKMLNLPPKIAHQCQCDVMKTNVF